jgi:hypothetical protein
VSNGREDGNMFLILILIFIYHPCCYICNIGHVHYIIHYCSIYIQSLSL